MERLHGACIAALASRHASSRLPCTCADAGPQVARMPRPLAQQYAGGQLQGVFVHNGVSHGVHHKSGRDLHAGRGSTAVGRCGTGHNGHATERTWQERSWQMGALPSRHSRGGRQLAGRRLPKKERKSVPWARNGLVNGSPGRRARAFSLAPAATHRRWYCGHPPQW